mmetsp:Transcript_95904/g.143605  ORF Transcript_95904/g.143605 Transcript_95904/m.143605 type:complete len:94 (-) Transcript_95904:13-294(-)
MEVLAATTTTTNEAAVLGVGITEEEAVVEKLPASSLPRAAANSVTIANFPTKLAAAAEEEEALDPGTLALEIVPPRLENPDASRNDRSNSSWD